MYLHDAPFALYETAAAAAAAAVLACSVSWRVRNVPSRESLTIICSQEGKKEQEGESMMSWKKKKKSKNTIIMSQSGRLRLKPTNAAPVFMFMSNGV